MVLFYLRHETYADVAELADALDSGSSEAIRVGSSPVIRTKTGNRPAGRFFVLKERDLKGR